MGQVEQRAVEVSRPCISHIYLYIMHATGNKPSMFYWTVPFPNPDSYKRFHSQTLIPWSEFDTSFTSVICCTQLLDWLLFLIDSCVYLWFCNKKRMTIMKPCANCYSGNFSAPLRGLGWAGTCMYSLSSFFVCNSPSSITILFNMLEH